MSTATHNRYSDSSRYLDELDRESAAIWSEILSKSRLTAAIEKGTIDRKLFAIYMVETYHYTSHNARNQALVGVRAVGQPPQYIKFCFEHAAEETGHELMALHDVRSLGLTDASFEIPPPLPDTETLIAYLYWISATGNPLQRLGYSYWAENSYHYINPLLHKLKKRLSLEDNQLT
ncbi:MAG TPA: iron-containing redox enzyme family protein, partial [Haliangium sp.]|nr:iron-containing redox enzyme family protein [Haliangium sp.]